MRENAKKTARHGSLQTAHSAHPRQDDRAGRREKAKGVGDLSTLLCHGSATCKGLVDRRRYAERSGRNSKMVARGMERPHALAAYDGKDDDYLQRHNELSRSGSQDSGCDSH